MREDNYPQLVSDPEAEGLPGTADDDSGADDEVASGRWADGPDPAPLPADSPAEIGHFGTTPEEAREGESLDYKLARERFDGRSDADERDRADNYEDEQAEGPGTTDSDEPPLEYTRSKVSLYDRPDLIRDGGRPVGRLVDADNGGPFDNEKDLVGYDAGAAGGGATAEELAMHEVDEP